MRKSGARTGRARAAAPQRGSSYIEILIAATVLTIGIVGVFGAVSTAALDIYYGGRETIASEQGQAILERIRNAASYDDLLSYADTPPAGATSPRPAYVQGNRDAWLTALGPGGSSGIGRGQGTIIIAQQGTVPNRLATITVGVDWAGRKGPSPPTFVTRVSEWP